MVMMMVVVVVKIVVVVYGADGNDDGSDDGSGCGNDCGGGGGVGYIGGGDGTKTSDKRSNGFGKKQIQDNVIFGCSIYSSFKLLNPAAWILLLIFRCYNTFSTFPEIAVKRWL